VDVGDVAGSGRLRKASAATTNATAAKRAPRISNVELRDGGRPI
jgi:hypothetical protein